METSTSEVLLKCLNVLELTEDRCPSIQHLADGKIYCHLVSILKNETTENENLASLTPTLEMLLQEHFAGANLVVFEEAVGGNCEELTKLTLLLLYITLFTNAKLRGRLVNSALDQATQARFKYLLEAVQRRGSSISSRFLHILCTEDIGAKSPSWAHSQVNGAEWRSPRVYTTSPKSSIASPLRELVQSPHFRLQELLNSKKREVKRLQHQVTILEGDKQDMTHTITSGNNKITKLREEVNRLKDKLQANQQQQDEAQAQAAEDDDFKLQRVKELAVKCSQLRKDNTSLQQTEARLKEENDDLCARNSSLHQQLQVLRLDKDRLEVEVGDLREAKFESEALIESQASDIREMKTQLEELQHLMEHKNASVSIEESFGNSPPHYSVNSLNSSGGENMAEAVVEKILKEELRQLQLQHLSLQQDFAAATTMKDQLLEQTATHKEHSRCLSEEVKQKTSALASLTEELNGAHETISNMVKEKKDMLKIFENEKMSLNAVIKAQEDSLSALQQQVKESLEETNREKSVMMMKITLKEEEYKDLEKRLVDSKKSSEEEELKFITSLQEKEKCITELKGQISKFRTQMNEEKAALDVQIKLIEKAAVNEKVKMESTFKIMMEEKEGENQRQKNLIEELQSEKNSLLKMHHEEKCLLTNMVEEHEAALETLQQKFDSVTSQHVMEKEKLVSDLRCSQESSSSLIKELEEAQESHKLQFAKQQLTLQEKMTEILLLKEQIESVKEVHDDSLKKSEGEVQKLSASLELEQQCVTELRYEIAALIETKSKYSDCLDRLRESNTQLSKEIKELKDCAGSFQNCKQMLEEEKMELIANVQEKEKCIMELKEEMGRLGEQINEEKAAVDARFKTIEKDSYEEQLKMESTMKAMREEKEEAMLEKQNIIVELKNEKDKLCTLHLEEKSLLTNMIEEHKTTVEALQQKCDDVTSQHLIEKKKLESDVFDLTKNIEVLKEVHEDLLKKSDCEVQRLTTSLDAEQQCVTQLRQEITALMDTKSKDSDCLDRLHECNEQLKKEITELKDCAIIVENSKQTLERENLKLITNQQKNDECIIGLKEEIDKLKTQMNEEKTTVDAKFKMIEENSFEELQKMESTIKSITEEKSKEIKRKESLIAELQSEKDSLSKMHLKEKGLLTNMAEEQKTALETLQHKFDYVTNQHITEKEKLESEVLDLTKKIETLKEVQEDLLRKSESEIQRLSASFDAEQQCVTELKQEIAFLMDTKSNDSDHTVRLKESNEQLNKEITVLKHSLAEVNEKCLTLKQESEEATQQHNNEMASQKEELMRTEEAVSSLLKEVKNNKQVFEEEKSKFVTDLEEREKCITQLKEEICEIRVQIEKQQSAHDAHIKAVEADSRNEQQRLESTISSIKKEKARERQEMEGLVAELQKEKDIVRQNHHKEKCVLTELVEEHKAACDALQERLENLRKQHKVEKEQFESDLQVAKSALREADTKDTLVYRESIQELSNEIAVLKGHMAEQNKRYLMLQKEAEKPIVHLTSEELKDEERPSKQEEVHQALHCETDHYKQMLEKEKHSLLSTIREREETIMQLREELKQLQEQKNKEKAILQKQVGSNRQTLEHEQLLMSCNKTAAADLLLGHKQEVNSLHKDLQQLKRQLTEATDSLQQHRAEATALNQKLAASEAESKNHHSRVLTLESHIIDKEKALAASKEELMRVERESEKSFHSLREELQAAKEKAKLERGTADRIRKTYKTEVEKLTLQAGEWEREKKEKDLVLKKYETAKEKLGETVTLLDEARTTNKHYQQQLSQFKDCIKKLEENLVKEKSKGSEAQSRLLEVEGKYQPLKEKLHESENIIKRLGAEKRSLEMQLHHAEGQIKEQKKIQQRESFWEAPGSSSHRLTRMSISDSQVQSRRALRSTTSSSSADEYWGCNDSTEKLLPKKRLRDQVQRRVHSDTEDMVFLKPETRAKVAGGCSISGEERVSKREALAAPTGTKTHCPALPPPEIVLDRSLGKSIPRSMHFRCDEEEEEIFNNKYLHDMKIGRCNPAEDEQWRRLSELQRRNSLYPPHMRSAYPVEMQFRPPDDFEDDKLREGCAVDDRQLLNLTEATENLELDSPAFNLRKRKSPSDSVISETSLDSSEGKKTRRLSTSYSRPGPPTPGRRLSRGDKENRRESSASELSLSLWQGHRKEGAQGLASRGNSPVMLHPQPDSGRLTRRRQMGRTTSSSSVRCQSSPARSPTVLSKKGMSTPQGRKGMTPSSLRKILSKGKSPWKKFDNNDETPKGLGDSANSNGSSILRIFRKPFGSRNYNVLSASLRSQEKPGNLDDSLTTSACHSSGTTTELRQRRRR